MMKTITCFNVRHARPSHSIAPSTRFPHSSMAASAETKRKVLRLQRKVWFLLRGFIHTTITTLLTHYQRASRLLTWKTTRVVCRGGDDVKPHQSRLIRDQQLTSTSNGAAAAVEETGMYLLKNSGSDYHHQDTKDCWGASSTMMQLNSPFLGTAMGRPSSNNEPALVPGLRPPILPPSHHLTSQTPSVKIEYDTEKMITVPAVQEQQQRTTSPTTPPLLPENLVNTGASTASAADMTIVPLQRDLPSFLRHKLKSTQKLLDKKKKTVPFWKQNTKSANNCCISQIATHKNGRKRRLADMSPRSLELFKADVWNYHHIWQKHLSQIPDEREVAASKHFMSIRQTI
eukprot:TRINITY_DN15354_c0_g1_i2.p1 TRINITY_DN15354_c0_g1~~TRINITY_DN15354_c0_g1_i2.p1  ORF type:complete len:344 (-),score=34.10 TRINITY_DN15354_c0_g1_i2:168-1199(-)